MSEKLFQQSAKHLCQKPKRQKIQFSSPVEEHDDEEEDHNRPSMIDWTKCFICQEETRDKVHCSLDAGANDEEKIKVAYTEMPIFVDLGALRAGCDSLGQSLLVNKACHQKSCKILCNKTKLQRINQGKTVHWY